MSDEEKRILEKLIESGQDMAEHQVTETMEREAAQAYLDDTQRQLHEQHTANKETLSDELSPFMNVSLEAWAGANARLAQSEELDSIIASMDLDMQQWELVNAEWNNRMTRDTSMTIATVFGQAFAGAGQGQFGDAGMATADAMDVNRGTDPGGEDPITFEQWVKISEHMDAGTAKGIDPAQILAQYDMNAADWGTVGGYWAQKFNSNAMNYMDDFQKFGDKYRQQFEQQC